jgi:hypothetical protein
MGWTSRDAVAHKRKVKRNMTLVALVAAAVLTSATPAKDSAPAPIAALIPVRAVETQQRQPGLDVHIAPIDIAGDFQAKMLELSG